MNESLMNGRSTSAAEGNGSPTGKAPAGPAVATGTAPEAQGSTKADLLIAGRTLFAQKGFDGASVRAITELAGANLGAVTYHFGTKRDLYSAVLAEGLRPLAARVEAVARSDGSAIERTLRVVEVYFEHLAAFPDLPRLLLQEVAAGKPPPEVVREILQRVMSVISGLQTEGARDGSIRAGHPVLTALSVISQPIYLALVAPLLRVVGALDLTDTPTHDLALAHIQAFVRAGLAPHGEKQERMS